jgi:hypothetical protein
MAEYPNPANFQTYQPGMVSSIGQDFTSAVTNMIEKVGRDQFKKQLTTELQQYGVKPNDINRAFRPGMKEEDMAIMTANYKRNLENKAAIEDALQQKYGAAAEGLKFRMPIFGDTADNFQKSLDSWTPVAESVAQKRRQQGASAAVGQAISSQQPIAQQPAEAPAGPTAQPAMVPPSVEPGAMQGAAQPTIPQQPMAQPTQPGSVAEGQSGSASVSSQSQAPIGGGLMRQDVLASPGVQDYSMAEIQNVPAYNALGDRTAIQKESYKKDELKYKNARLAQEDRRQNLDRWKTLVRDGQIEEKNLMEVRDKIANEMGEIAKLQKALKVAQGGKKDQFTGEVAVDQDLVDGIQRELLERENTVLEYRQAEGQIREATKTQDPVARYSKKPKSGASTPPAKKPGRFQILSVQ